MIRKQESTKEKLLFINNILNSKKLYSLLKEHSMIGWIYNNFKRYNSVLPPRHSFYCKTWVAWKSKDLRRYSMKIHTKKKARIIPSDLSKFYLGRELSFKEHLVLLQRIRVQVQHSWQVVHNHMKYKLQRIWHTLLAFLVTCIQMANNHREKQINKN